MVSVLTLQDLNGGVYRWIETDPVSLLGFPKINGKSEKSEKMQNIEQDK